MSGDAPYTPPISSGRKVVLDVTPRSKIGRVALQVLEAGRSPAERFSQAEYTRLLVELGAAVANACRRGGLRK